MMPTCQILVGDCRDVLKTLPDESVNCIVTSPPYFGLRDYQVSGQIGLEKTIQEYVETMVSVFTECRRVLRNDGCLWLNLGDSFYSGDKGGHPRPTTGKQSTNGGTVKGLTSNRIPQSGLKPKDLIGIPWRVAFALQAIGWYLRSDIIWAKPNPMPESVTDRPTKSHEYLFLLTKSEKYFYDYKAISEPVSDVFANDPRHATGGNSNNDKLGYEENGAQNPKGPHRMFGKFKPLDKERPNSRMHKSHDPAHEREYNGKNRRSDDQSSGRRMLKNVADARANGGAHDAPFGLTRNKRTVWTIATEAFKGSHFATFPTDLVKPCILAGCPVGGTMLDPFGGSGTVGEVALELGRNAILIELNPEYVALAEKRTNVTPGLAL